jgi:hypothetical protein
MPQKILLAAKTFEEAQQLPGLVGGCLDRFINRLTFEMPFRYSQKGTGLLRIYDLPAIGGVSCFYSQARDGWSVDFVEGSKFMQCPVSAYLDLLGFDNRRQICIDVKEHLFRSLDEYIINKPGVILTTQEPYSVNVTDTTIIH